MRLQHICVQGEHTTQRLRHCRNFEVLIGQLLLRQLEAEGLAEPFRSSHSPILIRLLEGEAAAQLGSGMQQVLAARYTHAAAVTDCWLGAAKRGEASLRNAVLHTSTSAGPHD